LVFVQQAPVVDGAGVAGDLAPAASAVGRCQQTGLLLLLLLLLHVNNNSHACMHIHSTKLAVTLNTHCNRLAVT
jgi:hypothetical protein